jgi:hypothetical protein
MPTSQVYQATVTLTDAQVKALPTTPAVIVPPTEVLNYSGVPVHLYAPLLGIARVATHLADYANVDSTCIFGFNLGSDNSFTYSTQSLVGSADNILNTAGGIGVFSPATLTGSAAGALTLAFTNTLSDALLDNAVVFSCLNGGAGDFTGGDSGNELKLTVFYVLVEV